MVEELICAFCGKTCPEEPHDIEEPGYLIDSDGDVVCMECFTSAAKCSAPKLTEYPEKNTYWVDEIFTGSYFFSAEWISDNKYRGHWELTSTKYEQLHVEDVDAAMHELEEEGTHFVLAELNGMRQLWIEK